MGGLRRGSRGGAGHPEHLVLSGTMLARKVPEELVMPAGQRLVAGVAIAVAVQCQGALVHHRPVTGGRPRLDLPGHRLSWVKSESVEIEDTHMWLVARVGHGCRGAVDLNGAVVTVLGGRGFAVPRWSRRRLSACTRCRESEGQASRGERRAKGMVSLGRQDVVSMQCLR